MERTRSRQVQALWMTITFFAVVSCNSKTEEPEQSSEPPAENPFACEVNQNAPYDSTTPYLGIHGDAGNSDIVECDTADNFVEQWHVLKGHAIAQPNTFSPDNQTTYVTAFPNSDDPCTLFAIDVVTGETKWCKPLHRSIAGASVEVDENGNLYVTAQANVYSYLPSGELRWRQPLDGADGEDPEFRSFGLHFTPSGFIATVTLPGVVSLLERETGRILTQFDIAAEYGFVAPEPRLPDSIDLLNFFQKALPMISLRPSVQGRRQTPLLEIFWALAGVLQTTLLGSQNGMRFISKVVDQLRMMGPSSNYGSLRTTRRSN